MCHWGPIYVLFITRIVLDIWEELNVIGSFICLFYLELNNTDLRAKVNGGVQDGWDVSGKTAGLIWCDTAAFYKGIY